MLGEKNNHEILPVVSYQVETFEEKVAKLPFFTGIRPENRRVKLCKGPQGYYLLNERSHVLNEEKTREYITRAFDSFQGELDLAVSYTHLDVYKRQVLKSSGINICNMPVIAIGITFYRSIA